MHITLPLPSQLKRPQRFSYLHPFHMFLQDYDTKDLKDFEGIIMKGCDFNKDGKISKKELTMILLALSKQES